MGTKVEERRKELKMSQEELSRKSGVCRTTIVEIENDKGRNITFNTCKSIATALDATIDSLFFN